MALEKSGIKRPRFGLIWEEKTKNRRERRESKRREEKKKKKRRSRGMEL